MKVAFFSDTHGNLNQIFDKIDFTGVELIVFLGDNETTDIELFKDIKIKKIGVMGNHVPWEKTKVKVDIFKEFNIEDVSWKKYEYNGFTFFGIPGENVYTLIESMINGQKAFPVFRDISKDIENFKNKVEEFMNINVDIVLSHFPVFGIMDRPKTISHRGLYFLEKYIKNNKPKYLFHGHLHNDKSKNLNKTKIQQIYEYKIINIKNVCK